MARPLVEQRRLQHRGREFHFVSYGAVPANPKRDDPGKDPTWWLMSGGQRWEVMPFDPDQDEIRVDGALTAWLDENVFPNSRKRRA